jgi:hypothetical protein
MPSGLEATTTDLPIRGVLMIASIGAAALHFAYAPHHLEENALHGVFFLVVAWLQIGFAAALRARTPRRSVYIAGMLLNAAVIGVWVVSRTAGIDGPAEAVGFPDALATALEAVIVIGCVLHLSSAVSTRRVSVAAASAFVGASAMFALALVSASMVPELGGGHETAGHSHGTGAEGHDHDATTAAAAGGHQHAAPPAGNVGKPYDPTKPIDLSGTPGVTEEQQAQAENLIAVTLNGLPQWADYRTAEAAGFRSIHDGATGHEHFINQAYIDDDSMFDPNKPESLVYSTAGGTRTLVAAMYMTKSGTPLDQVPDLGGDLMQWHVHDNLCYRNGQVAGITTREGTCPPGTVKPVETPMIHIWITPHPCGPFAALEGIGGGRIPDGEARLCDHAHGSKTATQ